MLSAYNIRKSFGDNLILDGVSLNLNPGERAGLVGPNGCGKTAFLLIFAGIDAPDSGMVHKPNALRIGYLPRGLALPETETIGAYLDRAQGDLPRLSAEAERLAAARARRCNRHHHLKPEPWTIIKNRPWTIDHGPSHSLLGESLHRNHEDQ